MHRSGYTILEMLVTLAIFIVGSTLVVMNLRSAGEREQLDQAAVDLVNNLIQQQTRSIANAAPTECECSASCDCIPQWYGIVALPGTTYYWPVVAGNDSPTIAAIESYGVDLPSNVTVYRVRVGADAAANNTTENTLIGFMPPSGRVSTFIANLLPPDYSTFRNQPAYLYLRLQRSTGDLCRRILVEVNGRITHERAACP